MEKNKKNIKDMSLTNDDDIKTDIDLFQELAEDRDIEKLQQLYKINMINTKFLYDTITSIIKNMVEVKKINNMKNKMKLTFLWIQYINSRDLRIKKEIEELEVYCKNPPSVFNYILSIMSKENAWLIHKIFLDTETSNDKYWYKKYFSKTTFYKKKQIAIMEFGRYLLQTSDD
ncbi:MG284/MPN403 family protein [Mycoplasmopsis verecunda]|uniref:Uncharacterized protein n=1 Tax=Mycoplasmopsis verecunda TaxID=171291 RepID=A0A1T4KTP9_9BACT|nr:hypothetical protein [Mycoplasmopsis verecunda]WPB54653.1 hypothetical protein SAM46_00620 [Mycoplasmopsis verecunda]SJZ45812.1 hypothetical protein SAMN02745154_00180 [Mycoplasmopsis verecunda]